MPAEKVYDEDEQLLSSPAENMLCDDGTTVNFPNWENVKLRRDNFLVPQLRKCYAMTGQLLSSPAEKMLCDDGTDKKIESVTGQLLSSSRPGR